MATTTRKTDGRVDAPVPLDRQRFTFAFLAQEGMLVDLLNRIAAMDMFAVVTRIEITKEGEDYRPPPGREERLAEEETRPGLARMPPNRSARLVSGRGRAAPVRVLLDVEVYSFESEPEGEG